PLHTGLTFLDCTPSPTPPSHGHRLSSNARNGAVEIVSFLLFFFNVTAATDVYTLSLHDALPICPHPNAFNRALRMPDGDQARRSDRKSTRLNSSHLGISYAVFCLKKKINLARSLPCGWTNEVLGICLVGLCCMPALRNPSVRAGR